MSKHFPAFAILLIHGALFMGVFNQWINPHPDMLDHWVWSRVFAFSYYEHPPMVAWLMRTMTSLTGNSEFSLELWAQIINLTILLLAYGITARLFNPRAGLWTLILLESSLYWFYGSAFFHIDQPFLIFWLINLYLAVRFCQCGKTRYLLGLGVVAGFGALSKYITLLFYVGFGLHLLFHKALRKNLWNPWLYLAGIISLLIFTPVLWWNYQHEWVSFRFQFGRGMSGADFGQNFIWFTLGHILLFSPVWSVWIFRALWLHRRSMFDPDFSGSVILTISLFGLTFFSLMSFRGNIADPHWANVGYLGAMIVSGKWLSDQWEENRNKKRLILLAGMGAGINVLIGGLLFWHILTPIQDVTLYKLRYLDGFKSLNMPDTVVEKLRPIFKKEVRGYSGFHQRLSSILTQEELRQYQTDIVKLAIQPTSDIATPLIKWSETASDLDQLLKVANRFPADYVVSREYQFSSALSFYLENQPFPHSLQKPERNQWSPVEQLKTGNTIMVCQFAQCPQVKQRSETLIQQKFTWLGDIKTESNGRIVRWFAVYANRPQTEHQ
ncbi:MAG: glycosyltransferase family 39 protein [SAR324 cluster bacterium]|nr:glycosyltransferase family 39 protein [SAR324 cluster bacterium]